jgi:hypothetical protein
VAQQQRSRAVNVFSTWYEKDGLAEADGNRTHRTLLACRWF